MRDLPAAFLRAGERLLPEEASLSLPWGLLRLDGDNQNLDQQEGVATICDTPIAQLLPWGLDSTLSRGIWGVSLTEGLVSMPRFTDKEHPEERMAPPSEGGQLCSRHPAVPSFPKAGLGRGKAAMLATSLLLLLGHEGTPHSTSAESLQAPPSSMSTARSAPAAPRP